ncbi:MAG TPA: Rrf2 family transcriptional regulator [Opitutales bacterium]|nr:Rrf2 family transcriptional regulator [Opitutales bacterium]
MKISRKVEYACRVLAQLARSHGGGRMPHIEELAEIEKVPANYLVQILNELRNAGLILSRRGKQGGYMLSRPPAEIAISDIIMAIDGELMECSAEPGGESGRGVSVVLSAVAKDFTESAAKRTLRDILGADSSQMYFI